MEPEEEDRLVAVTYLHKTNSRSLSYLHGGGLRGAAQSFSAEGYPHNIFIVERRVGVTHLHDHVEGLEHDAEKEHRVLRLHRAVPEQGPMNLDSRAMDKENTHSNCRSIRSRRVKKKIRLMS